MRRSISHHDLVEHRLQNEWPERAADGNTYRYHATGLPAGGDRITNEANMTNETHISADQIARRELDRLHHERRVALRSPDQTAGDQAFLEKARVRSPRFPDVATMLERRKRIREKLAARIMLGLTAALGIAAPFAEHPGALAGFAVASFISFVIICWCAGSRHDRKYSTGPDGV